MAHSREENDELTQTGRGTRMGNLLRRYWVPILLEEELPEPDCPQVRVRIMGEDLIAFRDTYDRFGLVGELCEHRAASLWFGRCEEGGIRCAYHGWKYDVEGRCVDMPSEPPQSRFKEKIRLKAYPARLRGGIVWAYMGPPETMPELPEMEWSILPPEHVFVSKRLQESNYLQAIEGGIDSSHVSFAHRYNLEDDPMHANTVGNAYLKADTHPKFEVAESDGGLVIGARRNADEDSHYWRITQFVLPWYTLIPPFGENPMGGHMWVPIDDESCWAWSINFHPSRPLEEAEVAEMRAGKGIHCAYIPGTYLPLANQRNGYLMDRAAQKARKTFSGVAGIAMQDASLQESMGRIQDRTTEHLGTSDIGIIMARRRLLKAARALEQGEEPPGRDPASQRVRSASLLLPHDVPFDAGAAEALVARPGRPFVSL